MKIPAPLFSGLLITLSLITTGCGPEIKPDSNITLTPSLPLDQQVAQLNACALAVQKLKARGRFSLEWKDQKGTHRQTADANLLLQRPIAPASTTTPTEPTLALYFNGLEAQVALFGNFSGSEVFEMGVNTTHYWLAFRTDPKKAYIGRVTPPQIIDTPPTTEGDLSPQAAEIAPFRADRVLELMGLSYISYDPTQTGQLEQIAGTDPQHPTTTLLVRTLHTKPDGQLVYRRQREIILNNQTHLIEEIRTYKPDQTIEADAKLSEYYPIKTGRKNPAGDDITVPLAHRIQVDYPGRAANADLALKTIRLDADIPAQAFILPDFAKQDLEVINVDQSPK